jgi:DHA1 family multidrug resistance protein-like MFS transporter
MLPGMIMWGFWLGTPTGTAYVVATADKRRLTLTFSTISAAWSLGYMLSPAIGGYIAGTIGMRSVFLLSSLLYGVACLFLAFIRSQHATRNELPSTREQYSFLRLLKTRKLLKLSLLFASILFVIMMFRPFMPKYLTDVYHYSDSDIGIMGSITFASSAVLGILLGKLGDRTRKTYAISASMIFCCGALSLLLLFSSYPVLAVAFFLFGGSYLTWSLLSATVGPLAPEACSARWISVPQTVSMFSSIIAPYVAGMLYAASPSYPFLVALVAAAVLAAVTLTRVFEE